MKKIQPADYIDAYVTIPGSKSVTHRAAIAAALATGTSRLDKFLACEDTMFTIQTLQALGVTMSLTGETLTVSGTGGKLLDQPGEKEIFLGNSGTSFRLLLSVAALARGRFLFTGSPRMLKRPIADLVQALNGLGVNAWCVNDDGCPPVMMEATGSVYGGSVGVRGADSSQFISSLLLMAPYAANEVRIEVTGPLVSAPYVRLTLDVMSKFGLQVGHQGLSHFLITPGTGYKGRFLTVEGDASNASYFWAAAAVTGGKVTTGNIHLGSEQGDLNFLEIIQAMGCQVIKMPDEVTVIGGPLRGLDVDMNTMPDLVPTLAVMALFAQGKTAITNVGHLRHKESDRLAAISAELRRLGGKIEELPDGLVIHGGEKLSGADMETYNDHRMAMSLAVAGLRVADVRIKDEGCVVKSFPKFWDVWETLYNRLALTKAP
ncbi:MAG: 3-phosphoshikimate 1-carboxyvinyltransferase [Deltaproteobacteria bacterium]|nr:3-phosphoshikimate 1-carboxyvinyltransferase [Deltaproteobacteria bacterium]